MREVSPLRSPVPNAGAEVVPVDVEQLLAAARGDYSLDTWATRCASLDDIAKAKVALRLLDENPTAFLALSTLREFRDPELRFQIVCEAARRLPYETVRDLPALGNFNQKQLDLILEAAEQSSAKQRERYRLVPLNAGSFGLPWVLQTHPYLDSVRIQELTECLAAIFERLPAQPRKTPLFKVQIKSSDSNIWTAVSANGNQILLERLLYPGPIDEVTLTSEERAALEVVRELPVRIRPQCGDQTAREFLHASIRDRLATSLMESQLAGLRNGSFETELRAECRARTLQLKALTSLMSRNGFSDFDAIELYLCTSLGTGRFLSNSPVIVPSTIDFEQYGSFEDSSSPWILYELPSNPLKLFGFTFSFGFVETVTHSEIQTSGCDNLERLIFTPVIELDRSIFEALETLVQRDSQASTLITKLMTELRSLTSLALHDYVHSAVYGIRQSKSRLSFTRDSSPFAAAGANIAVAGTTKGFFGRPEGVTDPLEDFSVRLNCEIWKTIGLEMPQVVERVLDITANFVDHVAELQIALHALLPKEECNRIAGYLTSIALNQLHQILPTDGPAMYTARSHESSSIEKRIEALGLPAFIPTAQVLSTAIPDTIARRFWDSHRALAHRVREATVLSSSQTGALIGSGSEPTDPLFTWKTLIESPDCLTTQATLVRQVLDEMGVWLARDARYAQDYSTSPAVFLFSRLTKTSSNGERSIDLDTPHTGLRGLYLSMIREGVKQPFWLWNVSEENPGGRTPVARIVADFREALERSGGTKSEPFLRAKAAFIANQERKLRIRNYPAGNVGGQES